jgi:hypothetical protein
MATTTTLGSQPRKRTRAPKISVTLTPETHVAHCEQLLEQRKRRLQLETACMDNIKAARDGVKTMDTQLDLVNACIYKAQTVVIDIHSMNRESENQSDDYCDQELWATAKIDDKIRELLDSLKKELKTCAYNVDKCNKLVVDAEEKLAEAKKNAPITNP